jgi:Ino eighty subunit 2
MARPSRRSAGAANGTTSATISRSTSGSPDDRRQSIRLTVKAPPSKLREVMRVNEVDALKDVIGGGQIVEGPRRSRNVPPPRASGRRPEKPRYAEYGESDIEDDDEEEDEDDEQEDDEDADEDEPMQDAVSDQDEEDEDQEMEEEPSPPKKSAPPPKPPKITLKQPGGSIGKASSNPKLIVTPAEVGPVKSVEDQEVEDEDDEDDDEEASSELSEDDEEDDEEEEDEEQEETMQLNAGAALGASDMLGDDEELDEEDEELDSDDETPGSGTATPDMTKMTKRQRGRPEDSTELMALDMAPQQRKFFTDQEKAMKKDEHARKRKELTKRKIQEEKAAALNRLVISSNPQPRPRANIVLAQATSLES